MTYFQSEYKKAKFYADFPRVGKKLKTVLPEQIRGLKTFALCSKKMKNINSLTFLLIILTILLVGTFYNFSTAFFYLYINCVFYLNSIKILRNFASAQEMA
jgi:hypothetical protein